MNTFDPFGWFERILPVSWLHRMIRLGAIVILSVFLVVRIGEYRLYFWKPLWAVETFLFVVLIIVFIVRLDPVDRSRGIKEIIVPVVGGLLPFALLKTPPAVWIAGDKRLLTMVFVWMTLATSLTVWGMWVLRYSFSITVEVRTLVTHGPYRWIRHPIYLGEFLAAGSVVVWRWSWVNAAVLFVFLIVQLLRSRWEENKLKQVFPAYRERLAGSLWFWKV